MLCDSCKERDSVITLTRSDAEGVTEMHLCEKCAAEKGIQTSLSVPKQPLTDFILAVHQKQLPANATDALRCSFCSATLRDFKQTARLGCAYCYAAFEPSLRELLRRVHGNSKHQGKRYKPPQPRTEEGATVLAELRARLRRAVEQEQFEEAAKLRDQIRVME